MSAFTLQSFVEAVQANNVKVALPTDLTTAELRVALDAVARRQSFFSAQTIFTDLLDQYKHDVNSLLDPQTEQRADRVTPENPQGNVTTGLNEAQARTRIQQLLKSMEYSPDSSEAGTLKDLSSNQRVTLVLRTNVQMAQGQGNWLQSQRDGVLDAFPADELFRLESRKQQRDWQARFRIAGEATGREMGDGWIITPDGRMIALKNHPIWEELGNSDNFPDGLDQAWPPFAFGSGMWVRDVSRADCEEIGLLDAGDAAPLPKLLEDLAA